MPAAKKRSTWITAAVATALTFSGLVAGCGATSTETPPRAAGVAAAGVSPTPSSSAESSSPTPAAITSPSPVQVKVVSPPKPSSKPPTKKPAPKPTTKAPTSKPAPAHTHSGTVVPGAYCANAEHGWYGVSSAGNLYRCSQYSNGQWRWKRV